MTFLDGMIFTLIMIALFVFGVVIGYVLGSTSNIK